jgi:hypothetical protein
MRWQACHIIIHDAGLHSCVAGLGIGQTKHVRIHVHLFRTPGEIHMHLSLIRISFKILIKSILAYLTRLFFNLLPVTFCHLKVAHSSLAVLSQA